MIRIEITAEALGSTPLFTGSKQGAENLKAIAAEIAKQSKKTIGLFKFTRAEQIWKWEGSRK